MIKKWLTVVAAGVLVTAFASLSVNSGSATAGAEPGCGMGAVCWQFP
ncbi:hypothetical protein GCM10009554_36050 [Kribbella koreensis]|uniref:Uncharacterized protein n=2 Tax=Kribbella TaxID=182639 RepID=A0ABP6Y0K5_9ACTN